MIQKIQDAPLTRALRLYGEGDLRLEDFSLPQLNPSDVLVRIFCDSVCMSTYKLLNQGDRHKRVIANLAKQPIIVGHEFCGEIVAVGTDRKEEFHPGQKFIALPVRKDGAIEAPGYSYEYIGGASTLGVFHSDLIDNGCFLPFQGSAFFLGALTEPYACVIGAFKANYHCQRGSYQHQMGIRPGGLCALLAGSGPMGLAAIDYAINGDTTPSVLVVSSRNREKLARAMRLFPPEEAEKKGITLHYVIGDTVEAERQLLQICEGQGFDDIFIFAPDKALVESADRLLGQDGCLNFFAGPSDAKFSVNFNFYKAHYSGTHLVGTSGGSGEDVAEAIRLMELGRIRPEVLVTHIGGLSSAADSVRNLPNLPGGKKLHYTQIDLPLIAIDELEALASDDSPNQKLYKALAECVSQHAGLWNAEAEKILLSHLGKL